MNSSWGCHGSGCVKLDVCWVVSSTSFVVVSQATYLSLGNQHGFRIMLLGIVVHTFFFIRIIFNKKHEAQIWGKICPKMVKNSSTENENETVYREKHFNHIIGGRGWWEIRKKRWRIEEYPRCGKNVDSYKKKVCTDVRCHWRQTEILFRLANFDSHAYHQEIVISPNGFYDEWVRKCTHYYRKLDNSLQF